MANTRKKKDVEVDTIPEKVVSDEKVEEVKEIVQPVETKEEEIPTQVEEKKEEVVKKKPDNKKFMSEMKSFLTIIFIIGLLILGGWYWYKHSDFKDKKKDEEQNNKSKYVYKEYIKDEEYGTPDIYYNKYIVYSKDGNFTKVVTIDGKEVFNDTVDADAFFLDVNNDIYFVDYGDSDSSDLITIYSYKDNTLKKEFAMTDNSEKINFIMYSDPENWCYLLALYSYDEDNDYETVKMYSLSGDAHDFEGYVMLGDVAILSDDEEIITYNKRYVAFAGAGGTGLYDLEKFEIAIEPKYEGIYSAGDNFVVEKNDKSGLINIKQKILLPIEYDFIEYNKDYYVVSKGLEMAIMNSDFVLLTDYEFDFQDTSYIYKLCCGNVNPFYSIKSGDKYLMVINSVPFGDFDKNEAYIIDKDGKYTTVEEYEIQSVDGYYLFLNKGKKTYDVYNENFEKLYTLDLKGYDFTSDDVWFNRIGDVLVIEDKNIYFDIKTGEELENVELAYNLDNIKLEYKKVGVDVIVDGDKVNTISFSQYYRNITLNKFDRGYYTRNAEGLYLFIEK